MQKMILALALLIAPLSANAQNPTEDDSKPQISVSGEAEIRVVPDQVLISMTVKTRGPELVPTNRNNDKAFNQVLNFIVEEAGVDKKDVQTEHVRVKPEYQYCNRDSSVWGKCDPLKIAFFQVEKSISIRLDDLEKYASIITGAIERGATNIDHVQFTTTKLRAHKDEARELAAKAALEKARAIAGTLGMEVKKPISINLNRQNWGYRSDGGMMTQNVVRSTVSDVGVSTSDNFSVGQISIRAEVDVIFEME